MATRWLFGLLFLFTLVLKAEAQKSWVQYPVGNSGFRIKLPTKPDPVEKSFSPDSSVVYTLECLDSSLHMYYHWGVICVNLKGIDNANDSDELLSAYMEYLRGAFHIEKNKGAQPVSFRLADHPEVRGLTDQWTDADQDNWYVQGWVGRSQMAVLFAYGPQAFPNMDIWNQYIRGIKFPGDK